jgi:ornithine cyclodeaminase
MSAPRLVSAGEVARILTYEACIPLMRDAMIALSQGRTRQLLRGIVDLAGGNMFGVMPGAMIGGAFGAKLISIFPGNVAAGGLSHQGVVALFDGESGAPRAFVDAGVLTGIRTAAASAAATDALARPDATALAVLGTGEQALRHIEAIRHVRPIARVAIWGRDPEKARALAATTGGEAMASVAEATAGADIVCTVTGAAAPILASADVADGVHVNAVGSSHAGPVEIANDLVARARFFADHEEGVRAQGAEFIRAREAGLVGEDHLLGEIGDVMAGRLAGRTGDADVTLYKSLGSIVQDLAAADHVVRALGG